MRKLNTGPRKPCSDQEFDICVSLNIMNVKCFDMNKSDP